MYQPLKNKTHEIFHVHTKRCHHATGEDTEYIEKAIELGAKRIVFTDHAPFPGDLFGNRMTYSEYTEYVDTMCQLSEQYRGKIEVLKGLEIEYLPSFRNYYEELRADQRLDVLMLGQHFFEHQPGKYSFSDPDKSEEYIGLAKAMIDGMKTGLFDVVAHPDRIFRQKKEFSNDLKRISVEIIETSQENGVWLEQNFSSMIKENQYRPDFWKYAEPERCLAGYDAHSIKEIIEYSQE